MTPSMPILYFGDWQQYRSSPLRIITVGLNPSREEFPAADPWRRFPEGQDLDPDAPDLDAYFESLNRYFQDDRQPYMRWFGMAFGALLRGLDADFQGLTRHVALHTDLCSPLATDPTWSGLSHHEQESLSADYRLWHDLVEVLSPNVILVSVAERHLSMVDLTPDGGWSVVHEVARARPYEFRARPIAGRHSCLLVWGRAAQLPFGSVSSVDKQAAGAAIKAIVG